MNLHSYLIRQQLHETMNFGPSFLLHPSVSWSQTLYTKQKHPIFLLGAPSLCNHHGPPLTPSSLLITSPPPFSRSERAPPNHDTISCTPQSPLHLLDLRMWPAHQIHVACAWFHLVTSAQPHHHNIVTCCSICNAKKYIMDLVIRNRHHSML